MYILHIFCWYDTVYKRVRKYGNELLLPLVSKPVLYAAYGQGKGPIFMDYVSCRGTEQRLIDCFYNPFTLYDSHAEDAGVVCFDGIKRKSLFKIL